MNILFVVDKLELKYFEFNKLVTNFWMIKDFLDKRHQVFITTINNLYLEDATSYARTFHADTMTDNIFYKDSVINQKIEDFDLVMFRPDPPVDTDYITATY